MIMPIHAIRLSKSKRRKKLPPNLLKHSNSSPTAAGSDGGDERARTADLLVANQALSQLSDGPNNRVGNNSRAAFRAGCRATSQDYPAIEDDAKRN